MQDYLLTYIDGFIQGIPNLIMALLIFVLSIYFASVISKALQRILKARQAPEGISNLLAQSIRWTVIVIGTITALQRFFDVTAFLAGLGILGFTVGFALQDVMKNFAAGIILLLQQPFNVGDAIGVTGYDGAVLAIDLRTTEIKTWDGRIIILPNADVLASPIVNYSRASLRRIELPVGVGYGTDTGVARTLVLEALQKVPGFIPEPAPLVGFSSFGDSALELNTYFWIDTTKTNLFAAKDDAFSLIKTALDKNGIDIPFPIRTVYMQTQN